MALPVLAAASLLSGIAGKLGGKHSTPTQAANKWFAAIDAALAAGNSTAVRMIARRERIPAGQAPGGFSTQVQDFTQRNAKNQAEIEMVVAYAQQRVGMAAVQTTTSVPSLAVEPASRSVLERALDAALNAGQLELAASLESTSGQARTQAQARAAGGLLGSFTPTQIVVTVIIVAGLLVLFFRRK